MLNLCNNYCLYYKDFVINLFPEESFLYVKGTVHSIADSTKYTINQQKG